MAACGSDGGGGTPDAAPVSGELSFFITSVGLDGGNLGGLAGADAHCATLAAAAGAGGRTWRAYLSRSSSPLVNARDRIGDGPWFNARGVMVAANLAELHGDNHLDGTTALTERGDPVPGRGSSPNYHDILTGSTADGMFLTDSSCRDWTSNDSGSARVGHHDRQGGGEAPTSWNSAHNTSGCSRSALNGTGGNGYFYCFAAN